jgi:hypothetical protein
MPDRVAVLNGSGAYAGGVLCEESKKHTEVCFLLSFKEMAIAIVGFPVAAGKFLLR